MAEYPAFLFYPGDYLRDTQCLSEKTQVAYDRIMCEHKRFACEDMNLICLPQEKIDFFAKRLSEDEKYELMSVLVKKDVGIQIEWVAASISKTVKYNNSRAKNRTKKDKNISKDMKTYESHKEDEIENEIEERIKKKKFTAPEISEIEQYFEELNSDKKEAAKFLNFYSSKDWMIGKSKMKDWKAAARGWVLRNETEINSKKTARQEAVNSGEAKASITKAQEIRDRVGHN